MEGAQLERPQGHGHANYEEEQQPQRGGVVRSTVVEEEEHDDEHHHEKNSVLKKVKAKAKKIKDTLKHHGHGHQHENEHDRDDEESLEDDEMEEDPDVHCGHVGGNGAGAVSSTVIHHRTLDDFGQVEMPSVLPTTPAKDRFGSGFKYEGIIRPDEEEGSRQTTGGISHVPLHKRQPFVSESHATTDQSSGHGKGNLLQPGVIKVGAPFGLEEDPHAPSDRPRPPSNYESKTFDPTGGGGKEAGISPLVQSFEKMDVGDEREIKQEQNIKPEAGMDPKFYAGSHDQFAPEPVSTDVYTSSRDTESIPKRLDPRKPEDLLHDPIDGKPSEQGSSYAGTISSFAATREGAGGQDMQEGHEAGKKDSPTEYAKSAAMTVAEKLAPVYEKVAGAGSAEMEKLPGAVGGQQGKEGNSGVREQGKSEGEGEGKSVTSTVKEKLAPVYDKVAAAGSSLMSKVQGPGTGQEIVKEGNDGSEEGNNIRTDKGVSIKEYLAEKFKPGEEDKALSDMISGTLSRQKEKTEETGEDKPVGKVTESEEVARRLGSIADSPRDGSEEKGMVDMLKGAVKSWLGRESELQTTGPTNVRNEVSQAGEVHNQNVMGERRLQESGH